MAEPEILLAKARDFAEKEKFNVSSEFYQKTIAILEKKLDDSEKSKMELWSTKSEFLHMRMNEKGFNETWEDVRQRGFDCLRYLNKCCKLNQQYSETFLPKIKIIINQIIMKFGCILPENENQVVISCPIYLRMHTGAGKYSTSIAFTYNKLRCSICNLDVLDEECYHEPGETYEGKFCAGFYEGMKFEHLALVEKPKDANAIGIKTLYEPKKDFFKQFDPEELKEARRKGFPLSCHSCRDTNFDPEEITLEMFFEMQGQDLNSEPIL